MGPTTLQLKPGQTSRLKRRQRRSTAGPISSLSGFSADRRILSATFGSRQRRRSRGPSRVYSKEPACTRNTSQAPCWAPGDLGRDSYLSGSPTSKRQLAVRRNRFTSLPVEFPARQRSACWPSKPKRSTPSTNRGGAAASEHGRKVRKVYVYSRPRRRRVKLCRSKNQGGNASPRKNWERTLFKLPLPKHLGRTLNFQRNTGSSFSPFSLLRGNSVELQHRGPDQSLLILQERPRQSLRVRVGSSHQSQGCCVSQVVARFPKQTWNHNPAEALTAVARELQYRSSVRPGIIIGGTL